MNIRLLDRGSCNRETWQLRPFYLIALLATALHLYAQDDVSKPDGRQQDAPTFGERFWISGQANFIFQYHPSFSALYSGPNSLHAGEENATSRILTLYTGFRITNNLDILADVETAGGRGLSTALGAAGFTNVDVVRNPSLGQAPYVARLMLHWTIPLSKEEVEATRNPLALAPIVPARRLEIRFGKLSTVDFFDNNAIGSDSHLQFTNWAMVNNGAYDYAADTRGYTYGLLIELYEKFGVFRFGEMLMPTVANGITLDWDIARARADNFELELHPNLFPKRGTVLRTLAYVNHANMGSYREAIDGYLSGKNATPDITLYRAQGRIKYGFGLNAEQELTNNLRAFGRLGWNDGRNESFAYTEIDRTAEVGIDLAGEPWHRASDKIGAAFVVNGLSGDHRRYLALGGLGFILGDRALNYATEQIFETYYNARLWRGVYAAVDLQHLQNPGYNQDRGPVWVTSIRMHFEGAIPLH